MCSNGGIMGLMRRILMIIESGSRDMVLSRLSTKGALGFRARFEAHTKHSEKSPASKEQNGNANCWVIVHMMAMMTMMAMITMVTMMTMLAMMTMVPPFRMVVVMRMMRLTQMTAFLMNIIIPEIGFPSLEVPLVYTWLDIIL